MLGTGHHKETAVSEIHGSRITFFPHFLIVLNVHSTEYVLFGGGSIEQNYLLEDSCFTKNCVSLCHTRHKSAIGIHMSPFS